MSDGTRKIVSPETSVLHMTAPSETKPACVCQTASEMSSFRYDSSSNLQLNFSDVQASGNLNSIPEPSCVSPVTAQSEFVLCTTPCVETSATDSPWTRLDELPAPDTSS